MLSRVVARIKAHNDPESILIWRVIVVLLMLLFIFTIAFVAYRATKAVYNLIFNRSIAQEDPVLARNLAFDYGTSVTPLNQSSGQVVSNNNVYPVTPQNMTPQVAGANTTYTPPVTNVNYPTTTYPNGACDYLGNRYACVEPYWTAQGPVWNLPQGYMTQRCFDYLGNRYACVEPYWTSYGPVYAKNNPCPDYLGNRIACVEPYWTSYGRAY